MVGWWQWAFCWVFGMGLDWMVVRVRACMYIVYMHLTSPHLTTLPPFPSHLISRIKASPPRTARSKPSILSQFPTHPIPHRSLGTRPAPFRLRLPRPHPPRSPTTAQIITVMTTTITTVITYVPTVAQTGVSLPTYLPLPAGPAPCNATRATARRGARQIRPGGTRR